MEEPAYTQFDPDKPYVKPEPVRKSKMPMTILVLTLFLLCGYLLTGYFVIQPIGSLPEGLTIWYFRAGTNMRFIESPDGLALKNTGQVSLLSRGSFMAAASGIVMDHVILRLPYISVFYMISTGGKKFDR